jgi:DNA-binding NarL/FixJ family response regulator
MHLAESQPRSAAVAGARKRLDPKARPERPRLLIVEDDFLVGMELEAGLADAGFDVGGVAATADEAVRLARELRPDLVVMDVRLSGGRDGIDAAVEIRAVTGIGTVFATAYGDPATRGRAEPAAPAGWVSKPYTIEALVAAIRSGLQAAG